MDVVPPRPSPICARPPQGFSEPPPQAISENPLPPGSPSGFILGNIFYEFNSGNYFIYEFNSGKFFDPPPVDWGHHRIATG
jgi:hypothetical protein